MHIILFAVENNYQTVFYVSDVFLFVGCLIVYFYLEINVEKNRENIFQVSREIINPTAGLFFLICLGMGLGRGLFNNYGAIYLQEQMKASSAMIGENISIGNIFDSSPEIKSQNNCTAMY